MFSFPRQFHLSSRTCFPFFIDTWRYLSQKKPEKGGVKVEAIDSEICNDDTVQSIFFFFRFILFVSNK